MNGIVWCIIQIFHLYSLCIHLCFVWIYIRLSTHGKSGSGRSDYELKRKKCIGNKIQVCVKGSVNAREVRGGCCVGLVSIYLKKKKKKRLQKYYKCVFYVTFIYLLIFLFVCFYIYFFFQWICEWKKWKALVEMVLSTVQRVDKQNLIKMTKDRYLAWFFFPRDTKCIK